jgi:hypothetical protein
MAKQSLTRASVSAVDLSKTSHSRQALCIWCVLGVLQSSGCFRSGPPDSTSRDRNMLTTIRDAIVLYHSEKRVLPLAPKGKTEEQQLVAVLALLERGAESNAAYISSGQLGRDRWGNGYHIYLDVDGDGSIAVGAKKWATSVILWSNGPNMNDEKGGGDDIVVVYPPLLRDGVIH